MTEIIVLAAIVLLGFIVVLATLRTLLLIVPPNRVLVISGRSRTTPEGDSVGYRVIRGGRAFRVPMLERVAWMDLTTIPLDLHVENAYSKGGIALSIHAVANVKINAQEPQLSNAIERFLDVDRKALTSIVRDTLEGNLRGVVATLSPEQINEDRLSFAEGLIVEAEHDLGNLGIKLDTLKIQNVSDASGYLGSIGRRQTAEVLKEARVAEAERDAEATQAEAQARQRAQVAQAISSQTVLEQQNLLRIRTAELSAVAASKENEALVTAERARVIAEQQLEQERVILNAKRYEADIVAPARARREASLLQAQAAAAPIIEEGRAKAEAVRLMTEAFRQAGSEGERAYVLNMLPGIVSEFAQSVRGMHIDKLTVLDSGSGQASRNAIGTLPANIISLIEQVENATGVNLLSALQLRGTATTTAVVPPPVSAAND